MTCWQCSVVDAVECMLRHADNGYDHTGRCSCRCHEGLMGYAKSLMFEPDPNDAITIRCDRCGETVPYHDAVVNGDVPDLAEAKRIRARRDWVSALCSYCDHMMHKDD